MVISKNGVINIIRLSIIDNLDTDTEKDFTEQIKENLNPNFLIGFLSINEKDFIFIKNGVNFINIITTNILKDYNSLEKISEIAKKNINNIPEYFIKGAVATASLAASYPIKNIGNENSIVSFYNIYANGGENDLYKYFSENIFKDFVDVMVYTNIPYISTNASSIVVTIEQFELLIESDKDKIISIDQQNPESFLSSFSNTDWDYSFIIVADKNEIY